jgi:hypothetical protein
MMRLVGRLLKRNKPVPRQIRVGQRTLPTCTLNLTG